jgi:hypothetical protein
MPQNKMAKALGLPPLVSQVTIRSRDMDPGRRYENARIAGPSTPEMGEEDA